MRTWKKLYRVTWNERMSTAQLLAAVREAFPDLDEDTYCWHANRERHTLYIRDAEGSEFYVATVDFLRKHVIQRVMNAFEVHNIPNPLFFTVENEGVKEMRIHDAGDWWPGINMEANESAVLDSQSLYLTIVRHLDDGVDPVADEVFAATDEQVGLMFHALRRQAAQAVKRDEWDSALFDTGCEMIAVDEEYMLCPSNW